MNVESREPRYIVDGRDIRATVLIGSRMAHPTVFQMTHEMIAHLVDGRVLCPRCALTVDLSQAAGLYPVNVVPYSQGCHGCGRVLVSGWDCQLFTAPAPESTTANAFAAVRLNDDGERYIDISTIAEDPAESAELAAAHGPFVIEPVVIEIGPRSREQIGGTDV